MKYWGEIKQSLMELYLKKDKTFTWNNVADMLQTAYKWGSADKESYYKREDKTPYECCKYGHVYESDCVEHYSIYCAQCGEMSWERMITDDASGYGGDWGGTRYFGYIPRRCQDCGEIIGGNYRRIPTEEHYNECYQWCKENKKGSSHIFYASFHSRIRYDGEVEMLLLDETIFKVVKDYKEFRQAWVERLRIE
jgi:hypothetical protein